jgi:hypothetical protein
MIMDKKRITADAEKAVPILKSFQDYMVDAGQRSVLFLDVLNKRGNNFMEHIEEGKPPVLTFDYEIIIDGKTMNPPVNFSLARICDRRRSEGKTERPATDKRTLPAEDQSDSPEKRPIIIVDPRAGHGPGIGGSKRDSEIGMALNQGHPVYFILFAADPMPNQTFADVHNTEIAYIEEVRRRHPDAE